MQELKTFAGETANLKTAASLLLMQHDQLHCGSRDCKAGAYLHDALHCQLPHTRLIRLPQHSNKRPQCILLVSEVLQLRTCQQLGHQLPQGVNSI